MQRILFLILLCSSFLSAEEKTPYLTSECDTLALVEGVVNAYNGKLVQIDRDIKIQGSDPLEMTRFYDGGHHFDSEFGYGIGCSHPALLIFKGSKDKNYVSVELRQGLEVLCEVKKHKKIFTGGIDPDYYKSGYTNCCSALLQGEPSLAAMQVEVGENHAIVTLGDGTKRHYSHFENVTYEGSYYRLNFEERPNGNKRYFSYDARSFPFSLKQIETTNSDKTLVLNSLDFSYEGNQVFVKASNGQRAQYTLKLEKGKAKKSQLFRNTSAEYKTKLLEQAVCDQHPATYYEPIKHTHSLSTLFSLRKVKLPSGRFLKVDYDDKERVSKLYASGNDQPLYTFHYHKNHTDVIDARGAKKTYHFTKRRLTKLTEPHRSQTYAWDAKGQLTTHTILTSTEEQVCEKSYKYDDKGNILKIKTKSADHSHVVRYTYNERNLPLTENHSDLVEYAYAYVPNTNLVSKKLISVEQALQEREFYEYDKNAILIRKIVDDGCMPDPSDLTNVSYRLITEIEPHLNLSLPGMTLPYITREWYLDLNTNQKHLLKKIERTYTQGDLLAEEKVFDANDTYCYSLTYEYNPRRELIRETNALGETTLYSYDDNGNKIYQEKVGSGKKTHFIYDIADRLIEEKEEHPDRILSKTYSYDPLRNRLSKKDIYNQITTYQYDLSSRLISKTDPLGKFEKKEYDTLGHITKNVDKDGYAIQTSYNFFGKPLEITYPDGTTEKYTYDRQGHLTKEQKRNGMSICYQVDYKGRIKNAQTYTADGTLLKTLTYVYKGQNLTSEIDALGNVTQYFFDGAGRKTAKIQGEITTLYEYDSFGRLTKTTIDDHIAIKEHDLLDRLIEERIEDAKGTIFRKVQYAYDIHGNQTLRREYFDPSLFAETKTVYNSQSLPTTHIDPLGFERKMLYRQTDHLEKETIDPLGRRHIEIFDPLQQLQETKAVSKEGTLLAHSHFSHNGRGYQIERTDDIVIDGSSIGNYRVNTTFDSMGQKTEETEQDLKTTKWSYKQGQLDTLTTPDGVILTHLYDSLNRLQEQKSSDGTIHYRFTYDLNDNLLLAEDLINSTTTTRAYDSLNQLIYEKQATGFEFSFSYDSLHRLKQMSFCEGSIVYDYSPTTLISSSRYQKDKLLYTYTQTCDLRGKVTQVTLPNILFSYSWDKIGRCQQIEAPKYHQTLHYDPVGNLIQTDVKDAIGSYDSTFQYDDLNQLTQEISSFKNQYTYDSLHNRRSKNQVDAQIDPLNLLTNDGIDRYDYDANGRRTTKGNSHYTYDALGRLISLNQISYQYDPLGRRIKRTEANTTVDYLYYLETEIGCWKNQLLEFRTLHNKQTAAIELNGTIYIPIRNHRGDIVQLLNKQSSPTTTYRYDAFGNFTYKGQLSPWMLSGQRYDPSTQLYHFDKRDYDPSQGRWLTPDPLGFADGPNLYAYVHNNPLIYVDPYGLLLQEAKDFTHDMTRAAIEDTSWGLATPFLGDRTPSLSGTAGHYVGTAASMAAGLVYGGTELRLLKGAYGIFRSCMSRGYQAIKTLNTGRKITHISQKTSAQKVFQQIKNVGRDPIAKSEIQFAKQNPFHKTSQLERKLSEWLGKETTMIKNKAGDPVFLSKDMERRIRFDFNNPHGDRPHMHIEKKINSKWKDATNEHRIYPLEE